MNEKTTRFAPPFVTIAQDLIAAGLPVPVPLQKAVDRKPMPLVIGSYELWQAWATAHGYADTQTVTLISALQNLARSRSYLEALAAEDAQRFDPDGKPVEPVSDTHRLIAALTLHAKALSKAASSDKTAVAPTVAAAATRLRPILGLPIQRPRATQ